jgi:serine/threonine protein kinase
MTSHGVLTPPGVSTACRLAQPTQPLSAEEHDRVYDEAMVLRRLHDALAGKYELRGRLGQGGMGTVYLARDLALERDVAIKVMLPEHVTNPETTERFRREARTVASLTHPNIIPVYAVHETDELAYFVMRYVEGRTLDSILRYGGPLPPVLARAVLGQVGKGLAYAHRHGVVHRDIKPANIMIDQEGWALIADFGIAKVRGAQDLTLAGTTLGTPTYMSPEQCADHGVTSASDQYALGVVAFELLTGRAPFRGSTIASVVKQQLFDPPPPLDSVLPGCDPELARAVDRMLAKKPEERWPSVEDAVRRVTGALLVDGEQVRAAIADVATSGRPAAVTRLPAASVPITPTTAPLSRVPSAVRHHRSRRLRSLIGVEGGALSAATLAAAIFVWHGAARPPTTPAGSPPSAALEQSRAAAPSAPAVGRAATPDDRPSSEHGAPVNPRRRAPERDGNAVAASPSVGSVLLGTRGLPAVLYVNDSPQGAVSGLRSWPLPAGSVRVSIRLEGCTPWDSTVVVEPDRELRIGYRTPRCGD